MKGLLPFKKQALNKLNLTHTALQHIHHSSGLLFGTTAVQLLIMITRYEAPVLLKSTLPGLEQTCIPTRASLEIYMAMNSFTDFTRHAVEDHNMNLAKRCFMMAEKLYREGDSLVKMLVENCFVYSFSLFMPHNRQEKLILESIIPSSLYNLYVKQVSTTGC